MPDDRYTPCETGIHVCGVDECEDVFVTVANFPIKSRYTAKDVFDKAKTSFAEAKEDGDLVVDLCVNGDIIADFWIRRQMLDRLRADIAY